MEDRKDGIISVACLLTGSLSYPLVCQWYIGLPLAVVSCVLWVYHRKHFESNRIVMVGGILGFVMVGLVLLTALVFAIYFGFISGEESIDWQGVIQNLDIS